MLISFAFLADLILFGSAICHVAFDIMSSSRVRKRAVGCFISIEMRDLFPQRKGKLDVLIVLIAFLWNENQITSNTGHLSVWRVSLLI